MKKILLSLLLLGSTASVFADTCCPEECCPEDSCALRADSCECVASSQTYFNAHPHFQYHMPEHVAGFRQDRLFARDEGRGGALDVVLFGSRSTNSDDLARYFTPFCKKTLLVSEDRFSPARADIDPQHFRIISQSDPYEGRICFEARQSVIGLGFHYSQRFAWDEEEGKGWYVDISTPLTRVKNRLCLREFITQESTALEITGQTTFNNMTDAFKNPDWKYGKICQSKPCDADCNVDCNTDCDDCGVCESKMKRTRLADIQAGLGRIWMMDEKCHLSSYVGVLIPTGNTPKGELVFEAVVGHGGHSGVFFGSEGGYRLWANDTGDRRLDVEWAVNSLYLGSKCQKRSFDLKCKPWSRYMEVYANKAQAEEANSLSGNQANFLATPGINVFTQDVNVTPGWSFNISSAFVFTSASGFQGELGWNRYCRRQE